MALHWLLLESIPHGQSSRVLRELFALLATAPGGILMGLYLPIGLVRASHQLVGANLSADALGTLAGYALMFLVALQLGIAAYGLMGVGLYLLATLDFSGSSGSSDSSTSSGRPYQG